MTLGLCKHCGEMKQVGFYKKRGKTYPRKDCYECRRKLRDRTRGIWRGMRTRCLNETCREFKYYGGRGITICDRWSSYEAFLKDMGPVPPGYSIERIDTNGNYELANCKWIPRNQQAWNQRSNRLITLDGETHHESEWARLKGMDQTTLSYRLRNGWSAQRALETPVATQPSNTKLTESGVREIRFRCATGEMQKTLAEEFGMSRAAISEVVSRKRWAHVE